MIKPMTNTVMKRTKMTMMMTIGYAGSIYGRYRRHLGLGPHWTISLPIRTVMMMITMIVIVTRYK